MSDVKIKQLNDFLNLKNHREVKKRVRKWLCADKSIDWAELLEHTVRERDSALEALGVAREALEKIESEWRAFGGTSDIARSALAKIKDVGEK